MYMLLYSVFFFSFSSRRRYTRSYGDWSSDVCSSDLGRRSWSTRSRYRPPRAISAGAGCLTARARSRRVVSGPRARSEERRVGKECRSGRAQDDEKKKNNKMVSECILLDGGQSVLRSQ